MISYHKTTRSSAEADLLAGRLQPVGWRCHGRNPAQRMIAEIIPQSGDGDGGADRRATTTALAGATRLRMSAPAVTVIPPKALILDLAARFDIDDIADERRGPILSRQYF